MPRGQGMGRGGGQGQGMGKGRMGGTRAGAGPSGNCICPKCNEKTVHQPGIPCYSVTCPKCGSQMMRE